MIRKLNENVKRISLGTDCAHKEIWSMRFYREIKWDVSKKTAKELQSSESELPIKFRRALTHPLSPITLSIANNGGSQRANNKSKLTKIILEKTELSHVTAYMENYTELLTLKDNKSRFIGVTFDSVIFERGVKNKKSFQITLSERNKHW